MHPCALLLDELLALIPAEEKALAEENLDRAEELAVKRAELLREVWKNREGFDTESLGQQLLLAKEGQARLKKAAEGMYAKFRDQQRAGRTQTKYLDGDRYVQAELQRSFYCDKRS